MKTQTRLKAILTAVVLALGLGFPAQSEAGFIDRLAADFAFFGSECFTTAGVPAVNPETGGVACYQKTVFVPFFANTLYVTLSTTGDTHDGAASCFTCLLDGAFCNAGALGAASCAPGFPQPVGWINLLKLPETDGANNCNDGGGGTADCHDNSIHYTWCTRVKPGVHTVQIRMATAQPGSTVFMETAHFYVDASRQGRKQNACEEAPIITVAD